MCPLGCHPAGVLSNGGGGARPSPQECGNTTGNFLASFLLPSPPPAAPGAGVPPEPGSHRSRGRHSSRGCHQNRGCHQSRGATGAGGPAGAGGRSGAGVSAEAGGRTAAGGVTGAGGPMEKVFWVPNRALEPARLPVILSVRSGSRCLRTERGPGGDPRLRLQDVDIRELPRAGDSAVAFTFFRSYRDGLWRFESAAHPGWFLCTSPRGHQPLALCRHRDVTSQLLDFYFQLC
ncbi:interleukin-36 receptor antagonist protein-like isoform X5 [Passer montanus]|uniref:interleukin-36 receptor antagonist protein-like isoform X5 n=1 Tax=Passer montanus TaxID=9160 RepID=UPI0019615983|nr:interleukin-36 receptor antagonist protein-like isoform X5 [Passer montanus]